MSKEIYISSTPHETRLAIVEKDELTEIYYERENEYTLAGSIYNGRVTRVLPGMQSSFVDIGLERDAFLYITDFLEEGVETDEFEPVSSEPKPRAERPAERSSEARSSEARSSEPRGDRGGERSGDRGGERRGRGRRGRDDRRRDGGASRPAYPAAEREPGDPFVERSIAPAGAGDELEPLPTAVSYESFAGEAGAESAAEEGVVGGLDVPEGSRRWRGRRGRRRGRSAAEGASPVAESVDGFAAAGAEASSFEASSFDESSAAAREPELQSAPTPSAAPVAAPAPAAREARPEARREGRPEGRGGRDRERGGDRGGRDRGGRDRREGRDRNRGEGSRAAGGEERFGQQNRNAAVRDRFAPRGARPFSEETVDIRAAASSRAAAPAASEPAIEPLILPGESLSKYRGGNEQQAESRPAAAAPVRPSTEVAPLLGWDGGAVLPGETLSRHRSESGRDGGRESRRDSGRESGSQSGSGDDRGRDRRRDRDERRGRGNDRPREPQAEQRSQPVVASFESRQLTPAELVQPAVTSQHEPEPTVLPLAEDGRPAFPAPAIESPVEFHETESEYEPGEEAAASFRVDPAGVREFRQSAAVEEVVEEPVVAAQVHEAVVAEPHPHHEHTAEPSAPAEAHGFGTGQLEEELLDDDEAEPSQVPSLHARSVHDDSEEETLEHAADLASMIRDMSIDDITRPESAAGEASDEDEDFEEEDEDFEEDQLESSDEDGAEESEEIAGSDISEADEDEFAEAGSESSDVAPRAAGAERQQGEREGRRGRRDGRRGGRDRSRSGGERTSSDRSSSDRSSTTERSGERSSSSERSSGERSGGRDRRGMAGSRSGDRRHGRHSVQASELPAISDLLKPGQEVLVQIAKEPIAKKGARITSHIALPGRFLVFMPTVSHVGVSRKIESDAERRRLKEILLSERGEASGGFIVRTAAAGASEEDLRSDLRFLLNLWVDIKARSESSKAPALIYHDLNLIERILRDQVTDNFSAIWVDTEAEYERVLRFLQRFQPALVRRVKLYGKETPLFEQFGINAEIDKALRSKVWLKSGGSIVINQTEALVAIDINTGKYVGKTTKLEDTIVKTNLDAIPEIVRQIRLRDLGGIIIIDFIDMDERKNRNRVMAALEEELKSDRAPSKVLQFNDFGLVAITRKRVKQSLERTLSTTCGVCQGTGMTKAPVTVCNEIYIELRKMHRHIEKGDILLRVHPEVVKQLKSNGGKWLQEMEELSRKTILVKSDPTLHPEQYDIQ